MIAGLAFDRYSGAAMILIALAWGLRLHVAYDRAKRRKAFDKALCEYCEWKGNDDECEC